MTTYELVDVDSGNWLGFWDSRDGAAAVVRAMVERGDSFEHLALGMEDTETGAFTVLHDEDIPKWLGEAGG